MEMTCLGDYTSFSCSFCVLKVEHLHIPVKPLGRDEMLKYKLFLNWLFNHYQTVMISCYKKVSLLSPDPVTGNHTGEINDSV